MNIGINGYEAVVPRFGYDSKTGLPVRVGSSEYCYQLITNLFSADKKNNYFIYLPVFPTNDMPKPREKWRYIVFNQKLWTILGLSKKLFENKTKLDVFFAPTHYLPLISKVPSVLLILDVSYLKFPELFNKKDLYQLKIWGGYSMKKAKKIITISQSSKNDIIKSYNVSSEKVVVVYPGIKSEKTNSKFKMQNSKSISEKFGIKGKYILFVGTLQPRKNIERLIEAFAKLKKEDVELVIVGKKGWQYEEIFAAPKKFGVEDRVLFVDNAADEDLPSLYKNALMFVLPSLYEGFGLPVLEAMNYGCPVITSNISSLPEAGGDAALYVDPNSVSDIVSKMEKLLNDPELRKNLIEKGYKQVEKFSWEKSAKQVLATLEEVAGGR